NSIVESFKGSGCFCLKGGGAAPILGKVFSHVSLVLVWSSSRKTCLPNLSRQQNQTKNTKLSIFCLSPKFELFPTFNQNRFNHSSI
ncbi:hypothetical protein, partial [Lactiplantibacillus plantarum]|uniref:hypothetical protein n=1 Tax=Lactiplantibacillus plantarum TaxID=1590 RepID=UPI001C9E93D6